MKRSGVTFSERSDTCSITPDKQVERALFERACGYKHPEDKIFCHEGEITIQPTIKHYPPDPVSMIFWLKNRQKDKWRDKVEHEHSGKDGKPIRFKIEDATK